MHVWGHLYKNMTLSLTAGLTICFDRTLECVLSLSLVFRAPTHIPRVAQISHETEKEEEENRNIANFSTGKPQVTTVLPLQAHR